MQWFYAFRGRARPTKLNHHWSLFATPTDGIGGGYADTIDTDTIETECLNVSAEEHSSSAPWMPRYCLHNSGQNPTLLICSCIHSFGAAEDSQNCLR